LLPEPARVAQGETPRPAGAGNQPAVCEWKPAGDRAPGATAPRADPFVRQASLGGPAPDAQPTPAEESPRPRPADLPSPRQPGHAADYSWLSGEVEYWRVVNGWRLRYACPPETDAYGGSVTLRAEGNKLAGLEDGQRVVVRGHLVTPASGGAVVVYEVEAIQPLPAP
jgi:hypothetical protein